MPLVCCELGHFSPTVQSRHCLVNWRHDRHFSLWSESARKSAKSPYFPHFVKSNLETPSVRASPRSCAGAKNELNQRRQSLRIGKNYEFGRRTKKEGHGL